jgi:hypothetical protein
MPRRVHELAVGVALVRYCPPAPLDDQERQRRLTQRALKEDMMAGTPGRVVTLVATQLMLATGASLKAAEVCVAPEE